MSRKIVVEAMIPAAKDLVWQRTQIPDEHIRWDIRFSHISYTDNVDERGYALMDYRTKIGFGVEITGFGHYLHSVPLELSTFEFDSNDWKSLITRGRGIWLYRSIGSHTYFKTVYDYDVRHGWLGRVLDRVIFRDLMRLATEWGFETLRQWCAGDQSALHERRSKFYFLLFFCRRTLGAKPAAAAAKSWLGSGQPSESNYPEAYEKVRGTAGHAV